MLETTPSLGGTPVWQEVGTAPDVVGPKLQVQSSLTVGNQFFRLATKGQIGTGGNPGTLSDPTGNAPLPPPNTFEDFASSTRFLYSGPNAVQLGVAPGTIITSRASVLRGKVLKKDGSPLTGARVAILNHAEFGYTFSRADGMFDLSVNGGPLYTVDYQAVGYCPSQRQVQAPLEDFRCVEDVILVSMDPVATAVAFGTNSPIQFAHSSTNTDSAGVRSATVLFPPGTCATLEMPDGTTQSCQGLTIRATEFTVGPDGPKAMPGPLPPTSAYTYAAELSGDEAIAAGARTIRFNQFVHVYVDNFLGIPTGGLVPNGYYDRQLAAWVPQENGVVIQIIDTSGGIAQVDIDGDGQPEGQSVLADADFTTEELQYLAANYPAGKTLWRMPALHFSGVDYNCPQNPAAKGKPAPGDQPTANPDANANGWGSVNLDSQVFEETIPLVGTPMDLHYSSARMPGYRINSELHQPLTGGSIFPGLTKVRVDMDVAGRLSEFQYPPDPNQTEDFAWDGYDAYGRLVNDTRNAHFSLFYFYPQVYGGHAGLAAGGITTIGYGPPLFGNFGQFTSTIGHNDVSQAIVVSFDRKLTIPDHRRLGLGGWSLTPLHRYDPIGRILYKGDGTIERPSSLVNSVSVTEGGTLTLQKVTASSDGSIIVVDRSGTVLRMTSAGLLVSLTSDHGSFNPADGITSAAQGRLYLVDGFSAAHVYMNGTSCYGLAVGPDDSIYYRTPFEILRFTPDGILHVILGKSGQNQFGEDGTFARDSMLSGGGTGGLAVGADGTIYYGDTVTLAGKTYNFVRKISPDGRLTTLAGRGGRNPDVFNVYADTQGYGSPAINCITTGAREVAVGPDGSVYFTDAYNVNRITIGGILTTVVNGRPLTQVGQPDPNNKEISEGQPGVRNNPPRGGGVSPAVYHMKVGADGTVYMGTAQSGNDSFLWKLDGSGLLQRIAGRFGAPYEQGLNPLQSSIGWLDDFAVDSGGAITLLCQPPGGSGSGGNYSLRRIGPAFPGFDATELQVASKDGSELYVFNAAGQHLRTLNTLTGTTNWLFSYDSSNLVTQIRDENGLVTTVDRAADEHPTGIVGPYGSRTTLAVDASGFLTNVSNSAGETTTLGYGTAELLTSIRGPRGNSFTMTYDSKGRANLLNDPAGGNLQISHSYVGGTDYSTVTDTAAGNHSVRALQLSANQDTIITTTSDDGSVGTEVRPLLGGSIVTNADGTVVAITVAGDAQFPGQTSVPQSVALAFPGGLNSSLKINRAATLADPLNPLSLTSLTTSWNLNGQVFSNRFDAATKRFTETTPTGRALVTDVDQMGRVTRQQVAADQPVTNRYDAFGRLVEIQSGPSAAPRTNNFAYNASGLLDQITDPLGRAVHITYDSAERPNQLTLPDGAVVGLEQDSENHLTGVTPPGRPKHQFQYDAVGSLTKYTPPVVTTDDSVSFAHDLDRNITNISMPDGQQFAMLRGPGGRPSRWILGSGPTIDFNYNSTTGQLTNMVSSSGDGISLGYQGSLPVLTRWTGSITGQVSLQFNANLAVASQSINGTSVSYSYDNDGLITQAGNLTIVRDVASGRVVTNSVGGVVESYGYNELGLLTNQTVSVTAGDLLSVKLQYDRLNRITNKVETVSGVTHQFGYAYDLAGRLSSVYKDGGLYSSYTYDANGNRLTHNAESATYDAQDRLTSFAGTTFSWSRNGCRSAMTAGAQTTTYNYDVRGALTSVALPTEQVSYVVDPLGRRIGRKVNGALERGWLWSGDLIVAEVDANSVVTKRFIYGGNSVTPAMMIVGANSYRIIADERGSVRFVINTADGTVAQSIEYDEFGRVLVDTNPGFQPFSYAGGLYDSDTAFVRFGLRDYDVETGTWTARDPIGFAGGQFSLYAYAGNDPLNFVDTTGTGPHENRDDYGDARIYEVAGNEAYVTREGRVVASGKSQLTGFRLRVGDRLTTGNGTVAALELDIGGRVGVKQDTTIELLNEGEVAPLSSPARQILQKAWGVWLKFNHVEKPLTIQTRGGVIGIRG